MLCFKESVQLSEKIIKKFDLLLAYVCFSD